MRFCFSILLSILILGQSFDRLGWVTYFYLYQESIAKAFCINLDKPKIRCAGKCYLSSQMKKYEERKQEVPILELQDNELTLLFSDAKSNLIALLKLKKNNAPLYQKKLINSNFISKLFRPPILN